MLEIRIYDDITIVDSLKKAIVIMLEAFEGWLNSNDEKPFMLQVKRINNKAPPTLKIDVKEDIKVKQAFGTK